ncbi:hypothetical protein ACJEBK_29615, partial [Peribacillus frigoritolerans]|uniref:hypothetical protein n=1 Tax=Peribacillus frigoritolerans TaxID=450367 RepID=UPI0038724056
SIKGQVSSQSRVCSYCEVYNFKIIVVPYYILTGALLHYEELMISSFFYGTKGAGQFNKRYNFIKAYRWWEDDFKRVY